MMTLAHVWFQTIHTKLQVFFSMFALGIEAVDMRTDQMPLPSCYPIEKKKKKKKSTLIEKSRNKKVWLQIGTCQVVLLPCQASTKS